jgi:hypothetical protein
MELAIRLMRGWGVLLGVPALFVVAYLYPHMPLLSRIEVCAVRGFLGCDCPGCGVASSLWALAHGNLRESVDLHPLGVVIALWLIYLFGRSLVETVTGKGLPTLLGQGGRDIVVYVFLAALILQWAVKLWIS